MELWIRSQEGNVLMPIHSKLELLYDAPKHVLIISDETILGAYDSRERVLEVLDDVQRKLDYIYELNLRPRALTTIEHKIVYEMPKE